GVDPQALGARERRDALRVEQLQRLRLAEPGPRLDLPARGAGPAGAARAEHLPRERDLPDRSLPLPVDEPGPGPGSGDPPGAPAPRPRPARLPGLRHRDGRRLAA